jgi:hypothetical protein
LGNFTSNHQQKTLSIEVAGGGATETSKPKRCSLKTVSFVMLAVIMLGGIGVLIWYFTRPGESSHHDIPTNLHGEFRSTNCSVPLIIETDSVKIPDPLTCQLPIKMYPPNEGVEIIPYDDSTKRFMVLTSKGTIVETFEMIFGLLIPTPEGAEILPAHRLLVVIEYDGDRWRLYAPCFVDIEDTFINMIPADGEVQTSSKFGYDNGFCLDSSFYFTKVTDTRLRKLSDGSKETIVFKKIQKYLTAYSNR